MEAGHLQDRKSKTYTQSYKDSCDAASRINRLVGYLQHWKQHEIKHAAEFVVSKRFPFDAPLCMKLEKHEAEDAVELYEIFKEQQEAHEKNPTQPTAAQFFGSTAAYEIEEARKLIPDLHRVNKFLNQGSAAVQLLCARAEQPSSRSLKDRAKRLIRHSTPEQKQAREYEQLKTEVEKDIMGLVNGLDTSRKEAVATLNRVFVDGPRGLYLSKDDKKILNKALKSFIPKK